ncbi:Sel1 repeat protein [Pseudomonas sp. GM18]|uniref:tetratricopeptide repeat protein n=1 Tax=Pseudomonas sp. GM18 TaxID=1144324 RepID=UPI000272716F|nr:tetratricopeptide repeat protein [Pseudomonas sp. GM18]EJM13849.1 Sel1 repeat protein [Pseudomonas sp. GM18]
MNKAVALLSLTALIAGCQPIIPFNNTADQYPILRCVAYFDQQSISRQQVDYISYLSERGDKGCTMILGKMYERGHGVAQDIPKAKALYQSVADMEPAAYASLARMAEQGVGGPPNLVEARQFYQRAVTKPGNARNEAKLAEYMENGKGGPQDFQGALELYLNAAGLVGDASWQGMERMRTKGLTLTIQQQQHYNKIFVNSVEYGVRKKIEAIKKTLAKENMSVPASKLVRVQLEYTPGSLVPVISLLESSGDSAIDQKVLQGFSDYRFPADPIMPPGQKTFKAIAFVRSDAKETLASKKD